MIFSTLIIIKDFKTKLDEKFNRTKRFYIYIIGSFNI